MYGGGHPLCPSLRSFDALCGLVLRMARTVLSGAVALLLLTSCGDDKPKEVEESIKIYSSLDACKVEQSTDDCAAAFSGAEQEHTKTAPRYQTLVTCEEKYGPSACRREGDTFMPFMTGFMMGHMMGTTPVYQPVYVDRGGYAYSGMGYVGGYRSSGNTTVIVNKIGPTPPAAGVWGGSNYAVARGGFGGSASSVSKPMASSSAMAAPSATVSTGVARGGFGSTAASVSASSSGG